MLHLNSEFSHCSTGLHRTGLTRTGEGREATGNTSCNKATMGDIDSRANLAPKPLNTFLIFLPQMWIQHRRAWQLPTSRYASGTAVRDETARQAFFWPTPGRRDLCPYRRLRSSRSSLISHRRSADDLPSDRQPKSRGRDNFLTCVNAVFKSTSARTDPLRQQQQFTSFCMNKTCCLPAVYMLVDYVLASFTCERLGFSFSLLQQLDSGAFALLRPLELLFLLRLCLQGFDTKLKLAAVLLMLHKERGGGGSGIRSNNNHYRCIGQTDTVGVWLSTRDFCTQLSLWYLLSGRKQWHSKVTILKHTFKCRFDK